MRRRPYPVMIGQFNKLMKEYNAEGIHDATGLGAVVADYMDRRARGFLMTGAQRDNMLSEYVSRGGERPVAGSSDADAFYKNHLYASVEHALRPRQGVPPAGRDLLDGAGLASWSPSGGPGPSPIVFAAHRPDTGSRRRCRRTTPASRTGSGWYARSGAQQDSRGASKSSPDGVTYWETKDMMSAFGVEHRSARVEGWRSTPGSATIRPATPWRSWIHPAESRATSCLESPQSYSEEG